MIGAHVGWPMTLVCRVRRRLPVAVVALDGTLDESTAIDAVVTMRGCLADLPVQLVLDVAHVTVVEPSALRRLADLVLGARHWPATRFAVCGASAETGELLRRLVAEGLPDGEGVPGGSVVDLFPTIDEAIAAGSRLPVPPRMSVELPPEPSAPAACRDLVARACREWHLDRWQRLVQLLASELVTNAVTHARTSLSFNVRHTGNALQVAVRDGDPRLVDRPPRGPYRLPVGEPGRGLLLLETLADDWGCAPTADGKVMWASVVLSAGPGR